MVEVKPIANAASAATRTIGQVVLKRLISGDQAIDLLSKAEMSVSIGEASIGETSIGEATGL